MFKTAVKELIDEALQRSGSNQKITAATPGIPPTALNKRLKQQTERAERQFGFTKAE